FINNKKERKSMENMNAVVRDLQKRIEADSRSSGEWIRHDLFKGTLDSSGKIQKIRSVGEVKRKDERSTYYVFLNGLLNEAYFLLPEKKNPNLADYVLLTREPSQ